MDISDNDRRLLQQALAGGQGPASLPPAQPYPPHIVEMLRRSGFSDAGLAAAQTAVQPPPPPAIPLAQPWAEQVSPPPEVLHDMYRQGLVTYTDLMSGRATRGALDAYVPTPVAR